MGCAKKHVWSSSARFLIHYFISPKWKALHPNFFYIFWDPYMDFKNLLRNFLESPETQVTAHQTDLAKKTELRFLQIMTVRKYWGTSRTRIRNYGCSSDKMLVFTLLLLEKQMLRTRYCSDKKYDSWIWIPKLTHTKKYLKKSSIIFFLLRVALIVVDFTSLW